MKNALRWTVIVLLSVTIALFAQDRRVKTNFHIGSHPFTFTGSVEAWNEVQKQIKLNNLLCDILEDESNGLHPTGKIALAKKLAKELEP